MEAPGAYVVKSSIGRKRRARADSKLHQGTYMISIRSEQQKQRMH